MNNLYHSSQSGGGPPGPRGPKGDTGDRGPGVINWRGAWDNATAYVANDAVSQNGSAYICLTDNTGSEPPSGNWSLLAQKGDQGSQGQKGDKGDTGDTGCRGDRGPQGVPGERGLQGNPGSQGIKGDKGDKGDRGDPGITWKGNWDGTTAYVVRDVVQQDGACYIALDANTNSEPPSAHWALLAAQGAAGELGPQGNQGDSGLVWKGEWNNTTTYHPSDVVECNGSSYVAVAVNSNQTPPADCWNLIASKGADGSGGGSNISWRGEWSSTTAYSADDLVSDNGNLYICRQAHTNQEPPSATYWDAMADAAQNSTVAQKLHWAGAWSSLTTYQANDVVTLEGWAYIARVNNTNIVPPDTSGGPAVYSGWLGGNSGNQYGCQVTFTAKTVTPTLNGFVFTLHCVSADQVPNPPYSYNPTAKTCDLYFPTPSAVGFYVQAMANLLSNDDSVAFVLSYSPERSGPLYSQPVVCVQTLRSGEDTWYTLSESANNFLYGFSSGESDTLKKGTPVSLYAFQGWGGTSTGTAGWADDGNGNSLTWQSATADEQWNSWGFIVVEDNSGNTASGPLAQMRSGGQDEPAHMVEIHLRSDQTTAFSSIWNAINAATNGDWATVSNSGTFDPAVFGMSGDWFMGGANNAIPPDDEPRLYRTDPNSNWTDQNTSRQHSDGPLNANCLGLIAQDVAARAEALVQIGGTIELDSTAWANVLVSYIARQFCPMPGPGGGGYWASERTNPVGELDPGKLYMTYVSLTYWGNVQSVGMLASTTGTLKGVVQGEDTGGNPTSLAPYYVPVGVALSPTKLLLRLGSGAF